MDFLTHLEKYLSKDDINNLLTSLEKNRVTSFILNTNKLTKDKLISLFPNIKEYKEAEILFIILGQYMAIISSVLIASNIQKIDDLLFKFFGIKSF